MTEPLDHDFLCAAVTSSDLTMEQKFGGVAAIGNTVVFAPYDANCVGVFESGALSCTTLTGM